MGWTRTRRMICAEKGGVDVNVTRVLIAGGGVAALEAALALRALAENRVTVELVAPKTEFTYRPLAVAEPFRVGEASEGEELRYDALLLALGARPRASIPGALTFRGPEDEALLTGLLKLA